VSRDQHTQLKRHARVRAKMLVAIHAARANQHGGWITGRGVIESLAWCGPDYRMADDAEAMGLLQDLVSLGYADEQDNREDHAQPYGLDHLTYCVSAKGVGFINRAEPATAMIDDGRIVNP